MLHDAEPNAGLCVIVGAQGALDAAVALITALPRDISVPIVLAIAGDQTPVAERIAWLDGVGGPPVVRASPGLRLTPGAVYLAPSAGGLFVDEGRCRIDSQADTPLDLLLKSAAVYTGQSTVGVLLSGDTTDGLVGAKALAWVGATVFVQSNAAHPELPHAARDLGLATMQADPTDLGGLIGRRVLAGRAPRRGAA